MPQIKNSLDQETLKKIGQSFLLTLVAAIGVFITAVSQGIPFDKAAIVSAGTIGAWIVNTAKEFGAGQ